MSLNAGCTREMLARGDWITPVFDGELRTHKPILLYWLMMTAYAWFGVSEFAARFWSAASAIGTALLTYGIGRRMCSSTVGLWAAVILVTTLMFDVAGSGSDSRRDSRLLEHGSHCGVNVWGTRAPCVCARRRHGGLCCRAGCFPIWPVANAHVRVHGDGRVGQGPGGRRAAHGRTGHVLADSAAATPARRGLPAHVIFHSSYARSDYCARSLQDIFFARFGACDR